MGKAVHSGARRALLEVRRSNQEALSLYESLGFVQVSLRSDYYSDPSEHAVVLALDRLVPRQP